MEKIWSYLTTLLACVIAGLLIFLELKNPTQVFNDNQSIGELKQRGTGIQTVDMQKEQTLTRKEERQLRRENRRRERRDRKLGESP